MPSATAHQIQGAVAGNSPRRCRKEFVTDFRHDHFNELFLNLRIVDFRELAANQLRY
jgi:hypothetical protein